MADNTIKTKAIVIRAAQSGENDRMLTLLSNEYGKLTVIAKGVRSIRHKAQGSVLVLCYSSFVLKKIKDGFYSLISAELIESFSELSNDIVLLSYGTYFASLCEMCVQQGVPSGEEIRLLLNSLYVLCRRNEYAPLIKDVFELKLCELIGLMPEIDDNCPCGLSAEYFCISEGEMRCKLHKTADAVHIPYSSVRLLNYIVHNSLHNALFCTCNLTDAYILKQICEPFLSYHLGNLPKSLAYLHDIEKKMQ